MSDEQPNNPLHGVTLKDILEDIVERHGWWNLGDEINIRCFTHDPNIKSSLKFLRKTPWARTKVEDLYLRDQAFLERNRKRNRRRAAQRAHRAGVDAAAEELAASDLLVAEADAGGPGDADQIAVGLDEA